MLCSVVCPGLGQAIQKRWLAAAFYFTAFMLPFVLFIAYFITWFFGNVRAAVNMEMGPADCALQPLDYGRLLGNFGLALLVFFVGLLDTWYAQMRAMRRRHQPPPL
jgi:hypothetical protein